jgi:uncharacterized protein YjbI with pentapeptide repeats
MGAYLTGMRLVGVYLTGVYLTGVYLTGVYLSDGGWRRGTRVSIEYMEDGAL